MVQCSRKFCSVLCLFILKVWVQTCFTKVVTKISGNQIEMIRISNVRRWTTIDCYVIQHFAYASFQIYFFSKSVYHLLHNKYTTSKSVVKIPLVISISSCFSNIPYGRMEHAKLPQNCDLLNGMYYERSRKAFVPSGCA